MARWGGDTGGFFHDVGCPSMMQLLEIVLYGKNGKKRTLTFEPGAVNIITGASTTGKSQIVHIVDYCCGSSEYKVAPGPIRKKVAWFGLLFQTDSGNVFVGRSAPKPGKETSGDAYLTEAAVDGKSPDSIGESNTDIQSSMRYLRDVLGIEEYEHIPQEEHTRAPLAPTLRHAIAFCLQRQTEVANDENLFHGQSKYWNALAMQDLFPYFLGAVDTERLAREQSLKQLRSQLRRVNKEIREQDAIAGVGLGQGLRLLEEARALGVVNGTGNPADVEVIRSQLAEASETWQPETVPTVDRDRLATLRERAEELGQNLVDVGYQERAVRSHMVERDARLAANHEQVLRLESLDLFGALDEAKCSICELQLTETGTVVDQMRASLSVLSETLEKTASADTKYSDYVQGLRRTKSDLAVQLGDTEAAIEALLRQGADARKLRDANVQRARVVGRISLWLENVTPDNEINDLKAEAGRLKEATDSARKKLEGDGEEERLASILRRVSGDITRYAGHLNVEHVVAEDGSYNPVNLDIQKLTLIIDEPDGPIMSNIVGSGKNWLGFTISTHLALHDHFAKRSRPVPNFLILDQPTQVFYPEDRKEDTADDWDSEGLDEGDRAEVRKMFDLVFDVVEKAQGAMQVIILDHADIQDDRFQNAVVERWRKGEALVPPEW